MLLVFHTDSGKEIARVTFEQAARPGNFSFLPHGKLLAVVDDSTLTIVDLSNGKQLVAIQTIEK